MCLLERIASARAKHILCVLTNVESKAKMPSTIILSPHAPPTPVASAAVHSNLAVVLLLIHFIVATIVLWGFCVWSLFCCAVLSIVIPTLFEKSRGIL